MRSYLLTGLLLCLLVIPVSAGFSYAFQNPTDYSQFSIYNSNNHNGYVIMVGNVSGGNRYVQIMAGPHAGPEYTEGGIYNTVADATTYAAGTLLSCGGGTGGPTIRVYTSGWGAIQTYAPGTCASGVGRYEVSIMGGRSNISRNGVILDSVLTGSNAGYIIWGMSNTNAGSGNTGIWDDIVYGSTQSKFIYGNPDSTGFQIIQDLINNDNSGLYNITTYPYALASSYNMSTTFGRGNASAGLKPLNDSYAQLLSFADGSIREQRFLDNHSMYGQLSWSLPEAFFNTGAKYGIYNIRTIDGPLSGGKYI